MTKTRTLPEVAKQYEVQLKIEQEVTNAYETQLKAIKDKRAKMEAWILAQTDELDVELTETTRELAPYISWYLRPKTNATSVEAYRQLRDSVQELNRVAKDHAEEQNLHKDTIGAWILAKLNAEGESSINCGQAGKAYKKLVTHASAADFDALIKWAGANGAADIVQKRVNSAFVNKYFDEHSEFPPFLNVMKEYEVVVTK